MQLNIFDAPFQAHSETSREAAMSIETPTLRERVYQALTLRPMTDEQIATHLAMNPSTARPRRIELVRSGRVREHSRTKTTSGRSAVLWTVV